MNRGMTSDAPLLNGSILHPSIGENSSAPQQSLSGKETRSHGRMILLYFTVLQLIIYADRSVINGMVPIILVEFDISKTEGGLLGTGFLGGFMIASPFAAFCGRGKHGYVVLHLGLFVWICSVIAGSITDHYPALLVSRILAGTGEAAFCSLAPPLINDSAPPRKRSTFIAVYFSAIFVGLGVGYVIAGLFSSWQIGRLFFLYEGILMIILLVVFAVARHSTAEGSSIDIKHEDEKTLITALLTNQTYCFLVLGYAATIFTIGGIAFWAPTYLKLVLHMDPVAANAKLGMTTGICGLAGSVLGGPLLDAMTFEETVTCRARFRALQATKISFWLVCVSCPLAMLTASTHDPSLWFVFLAIAQFFIFASTAPANVAMMEVVPVELRGFALGACTLASHLFGDLIPPVLVGYLYDHTGSLNTGMWLMVLWLWWSVLLWGLAWFRLKNSC